VIAAVSDGLPSSFYVVPPAQIPYVYNQGQEGACVAYSICGAKSIEDFTDVGSWNRYDAEELYHACGGTGQNGISTDQALTRVRDVGCLVDGGVRWPIASYLFAPESAGAWRETLAGALIATGPCVVATLLPQTFGWDSAGAPVSSEYHQMVLLGYEGLGNSDNAVFLNSWGPLWGNRGFARLSWSYLEGGGFQNGYVYGYQMVDVKEGAPVPPPPPGPIDFTATAGKTKPNGALQVWPDSPVTVVNGTRLHIEEL
jgi:hypothetical protein